MRRYPPESSRPFAVLLLVLVLVLVVLAIAAERADGTRGDGHTRTVGWGQTAFDFAGPERWAARYRREHRLVIQLRRQLRTSRRVLLGRDSVAEAINLAAATYGNASTLWRKARCETGGTFSPSAYNASSGAAGLFQFLPSTWRSTPYGVFDVRSPYANALAAGWMHANGRGGEWVCR